MTVRGEQSRPADTEPSAGTEPPAVRGEGGQANGAAVDGLLPRVARGDEEAFTGVCDQVAGAVYGLVIRIVADEAQAEQVAAEVLVEVWRSASRFSPATGSGLSWIMTIARRRAMRRAAAAGASHTASGSLLAHHGLASLPGPQREAVLLASSGYTRQRAADLAGVPADKVAEQLREGLLRLSGRPR